MTDKIDPKDIELHYSPGMEAAALFVKGEQKAVGDHEVAEEKIFELLGITVEYESNFMLGQNSWGGTAKTLKEIEEFNAKKIINQQKAAEYQAEADRLLREVGIK